MKASAFKDVTTVRVMDTNMHIYLLRVICHILFIYLQANATFGTCDSPPPTAPPPPGQLSQEPSSANSNSRLSQPGWLFGATLTIIILSSL